RERDRLQDPRALAAGSGAALHRRGRPAAGVCAALGCAGRGSDVPPGRRGRGRAGPAGSRRRAACRCRAQPAARARRPLERGSAAPRPGHRSRMPILRDARAVPAQALGMSKAESTAFAAATLDPGRSVVVEACAGSGKTWLLGSRILRLLLAGVEPGEILAITFTRQAAQEMADRLQQWLRLLAIGSEESVRGFLQDRGLEGRALEAALAPARGLYERVLTAQPPLTIATFHSWFLQLLRSAPLEAAAVGNATLIERTSALLAEAWTLFAEDCRRDRESKAARGLDLLFERYGLYNTRILLQR